MKLTPSRKPVNGYSPDLSQLADTEIEMEEMPMTVYQRYLKDKFFGETVVIKKENSYSEDTGFPAQRKTVL